MNDESQPTAAGRSSFDLVDEEALFAEIGLGPDTVLLDIGAGIGNYVLAAARRMGEGGSGCIYAVDLWREGIEALRGEAERRGHSQIQGIVADVGTEIPVDDASVDVCLIATVLHDLVEDRVHEGTLREVGRVLKDDGKLAIVEFVKEDGPPGPPASIKMSPEEVEEVVGPFGFRSAAGRPLGPHHYVSLFERA